MALKIEDIEVNFSADDVAEYINRLNSWINTRGQSDEKALKGGFLTTVLKETLTSQRPLIYPKALSDVSIADIQEALRKYIVFAEEPRI